MGSRYKMLPTMCLLLAVIPEWRGQIEPNLVWETILDFQRLAMTGVTQSRGKCNMREERVFFCDWNILHTLSMSGVLGYALTSAVLSYHCFGR